MLARNKVFCFFFAEEQSNYPILPKTASCSFHSKYKNNKSTQLTCVHMCDKYDITKLANQKASLLTVNAPDDENAEQDLQALRLNSEIGMYMSTN